jgi:hypothetical protein
MVVVVYAIYTFLATFNAGAMVSLQLQHYSIYPLVGRESFRTYMEANNRSALIPAIVPGITMHILSIVLLFVRPPFMTRTEAFVSFALNIVGFLSTVKWQRPLQAEMAKTGYDKEKIRVLLSTNWIRTIVFVLLGIMTISILVTAAK